LDSYDHFSNFASVSCLVVSDRTWGFYGLQNKRIKKMRLTKRWRGTGLPERRFEKYVV